MDLDLVQIRKHDPLERNVEKGDVGEELSPMSPPDAYAPPGNEDLAVEYADMHPLLQRLMDEHRACTGQLETFEATLDRLLAEGPDARANASIRQFFDYMESDILPHSRHEEKGLFPALARRLIENGEHSKGLVRSTAVDLLENEHTHLVQIAAVVMNLFSLVGPLPDPRSQRFVMKQAIDNGKLLVETLRLHMFREDHIAFPLAHNLISGEQLDEIQATLSPQ